MPYSPTDRPNSRKVLLLFRKYRSNEELGEFVTSPFCPLGGRPFTQSSLKKPPNAGISGSSGVDAHSVITSGLPVTRHFITRRRNSTALVV